MQELSSSMQMVVNGVIVMAVVIVVGFLVLKVIAFIQHIWRE